jgi:phosphoglycerate dehydrogenase-like enzyme
MDRNEKKNAVFFGDKSQIKYVYSADTVKKLSEIVNFDTDEVISPAEAEANKEILSKTDYIFTTWGMPHFERKEIREYLPRLKAVFYAAGSVQHFAREFLDENVAVFSAWAANAVPVAEYTFAQIILAAKGFFQRFHRQEDGPEWKNRNVGVSFPGSYEIKIGIIGAGMVGKEVIKRLHTLEKTEILVFDPFLSDEAAKELRVEKTDLETLFSSCDVISNHLANNKKTAGMLNGTLFSKMKKNAAFINTGRGAQVIEKDLEEALRSVPTRVALLDVTFPEPPEPDSCLYSLPNVILTPHIAGSLGNEVHRMAEYMLEECKAFDKGLPTRYSVSHAMLETMA